MVGIALALCMAQEGPTPVFAIKLNGTVVSPSPESWRPETHWIKVPGGLGVEFWGQSSGWMIVDHPALALEKQFTISAWLKPYAYVLSGPQAQIMFRGDDRPGLDPYSMAIHDDGTIFLRFDSDDNVTTECKSTTKLPVNQWSHVVGTFDSYAHAMKIWVNGKLENTTQTDRHPIGRLEAIDSAGLGVGNVQWDKGPHNQPYHGVIADLRLYNVALDPEKVGYDPKLWGIQKVGG
ncbi:MAG: hypothetical protein GC165_15495 [Armatimonadetes bacterium]|nr:hypothetical protein [Armatimonadota bacterium]